MRASWRLFDSANTNLTGASGVNGHLLVGFACYLWIAGEKEYKIVSSMNSLRIVFAGGLPNILFLPLTVKTKLSS